MAAPPPDRVQRAISRGREPVGSKQRVSAQDHSVRPDPVERVSLAPVNISPECLREGLSNREWWVSAPAIPGSAPITLFREESKGTGWKENV